MGGIRIMLGRREADYFPAGELISAEEGVKNHEGLEDRALASHERMRRIVLRLMPHWPLYCFYLHWSDGTDLDELDFKVRSGSSTENDFATALVGEAHGMMCLNCKARLRVVTWAVELKAFPDDEGRAQSHAYENHCPSCETRWSASVLEVISVHGGKSNIAPSG